MAAIKKFNVFINNLNEVYKINNQNDETKKRFDALLNLVSKSTILEVSHNKQVEILMRDISIKQYKA